MSKAAELAALIGSQSAQTDRNFFINGAMQVNQRGSVNTSDGSNVYSLDRWLTFLRGGPAATLSQSTDVPTGQGFANSFKLYVTTADALGTASDFCKVSQKMEGQNCQRLAKGTSSAKRVTLQFWVKSTITGTYIIELFDDDNTRQVSQAYTISSSNTWEHKTLTFPADTSGALADDNGNSFEVVWGLGMGSTYTSGTLNTSWANNTQANRFVGQVNALSSTDNEFYLTGCQLEIGDVATPFEHQSFGDELARCQRYFFMPSDDDRTMFALQGPVDAQVWWQFPFPTEMRNLPSTTVYGDNSKGQQGKALDGNNSDYETVDTTNYNTITKGKILHTVGTQGANYSIKRAEFDAEL
jgi:hypothetical protein